MDTPPNKRKRRTHPAVEAKRNPPVHHNAQRQERHGSQAVPMTMQPHRGSQVRRHDLADIAEHYGIAAHA